METEHKYWIVKIHRDITGNTLFMTPLMKIKYTRYGAHETVCRSLNCIECKEKGTLLDLILSDCEENDKLYTYDAGWVIVRGPEQCELDTFDEEAIYCKRMIAHKRGEVENHFETIMISTVQLFADVICDGGLLTTRSIFNSLNKEYDKWLTGKKEEKKKKEENTMDEKKIALVKFDQHTFIPGCCYELTDMLTRCRYVMLLKSYAEDELVFTRPDGSEYKYRFDNPATVINPTKKISDGPSIRKSEYVVYKKDYSNVFDTNKLYQLHNKVSTHWYADFKFIRYNETEHCFVFERTKPDNGARISVFVDDILIRDIWEIKETGTDICAIMRDEV